MPRPTIAQAIAYVTALEIQWQQRAPRILSIAPGSEDENLYWDVVTEFGHWVVWLEDNGRVYGEC